MTEQATHLELTWMLDSDMPQVMRIERQNPKGWSDREIQCVLNRKESMARVVRTTDGDIVAYAIFELWSWHVDIVSIAVDAAYQRQGIGSDIIRYITQFLHRSSKRHACQCRVWERNLPMQLLLRSCGFHGYLVTQPFDDCDDDAIDFFLESSR